MNQLRGIYANIFLINLILKFTTFIIYFYLISLYTSMCVASVKFGKYYLHQHHR